MNWSIIRNLGIAALVAYPASSMGADQTPDVKGKWMGKTQTILVGKGGHWPKGRGTWDKPDEPFTGALPGKANKSCVLAHTDGYWNGQLDDNDTLSFCYMHTGGK